MCAEDGWIARNTTIVWLFFLLVKNIVDQGEEHLH